MATFSNTYLPPTVRLGDTADPIATLARNTAVVEHHAELVRPVIVRTPRPTDVVIEFERSVVRRRRVAKRSAR
jgi:hypothetical protein